METFEETLFLGILGMSSAFTVTFLFGWFFGPSIAKFFHCMVSKFLEISEEDAVSIVFGIAISYCFVTCICIISTTFSVWKDIYPQLFSSLFSSKETPLGDNETMKVKKTNSVTENDKSPSDTQKSEENLSEKNVRTSIENEASISKEQKRVEDIHDEIEDCTNSKISEIKVSTNLHNCNTMEEKASDNAISETQISNSSNENVEKENTSQVKNE